MNKTERTSINHKWIKNVVIGHKLSKSARQVCLCDVSANELFYKSLESP